MGSGKKILSGVYWTSIQTIINRSLGFVIKLILARILFPEDYGLIGMAVVFTSFIQVFTDLGFGAAIIQKNKKEITNGYLSTAFWSGVTWSLFVFLIVSFIIAPIAANFYDEAILKKLIPVLSIGILASPINLVHRAQMVKNFSFKSLAFINNTSSIFSGVVAISLAFLGAGVWSLAFNSVASIVIAMPLFFKLTKWRPSLEWNFIDFKNMFGFGVFTTLSELLGKIASQGDYLIIGKFVGKFELGLYSFAFILADSLRVQVKTILGSVLFPVYAELQNNTEGQFKIYLKNIFFNSLIISPIMTLLIFGTEIVIFIFGNKWVGSVDLVKIIAASVILEGITVSVPQILRANNKVNIEFKMIMFNVFIVYIPLILLGVKINGVFGVAYAVLIYRLFSSLLDLIILQKIFNFSFIEILLVFLKGLLPSFFGIICSIILLYLLPNSLPFISIIQFIMIGFFILIFTYLLYGKELTNMIKLGKNLK